MRNLPIILVGAAAMTAAVVSIRVNAKPTTAPATQPAAGPAAAAAAGDVAALDRLLADKDPAVRAAAVAAFRAFRGDAPIEKVYPLLDPKKEPDPQVRSAAATALGAVPAWENVDPLIVALGDADPATRRNAKFGLELILGITINSNGRMIYDPERPETWPAAQDRLRQWLDRPEVREHLQEYWTNRRRERAKRAATAAPSTTNPTRD